MDTATKTYSIYLAGTEAPGVFGPPKSFQCSWGPGGVTEELFSIPKHASCHIDGAEAEAVVASEGEASWCGVALCAEHLKAAIAARPDMPVVRP